MMRRLHIGCVTALLVHAGGFLSSPAHGAGFAVTAAPGMGSAYAGVTARAEDAGTVHFNAAGMAWMAGAQIAAEVKAIQPSFVFTDQGSSYPQAGGMPVSGGNGDQGPSWKFVPNLYCAQPVHHDLALGLGLCLPYGLGKEYASDWLGRYQTIRSSLTTVDINPAIAWRPAECFALGAGFTAQYAAAEMVNAVDFGTILLSTGMAAEATPQSLDGEAKVSGDDWGSGFNVGCIYAFSPDCRIGFSYRSAIDHTLKGNAEFEVPTSALALQQYGMFVDTTARAGITTPAVASAGYFHRLSPGLALMLDVVWTEWSCFDELRITYDSAQDDTVSEETWEDSWRVSVGMEHQIDERWSIAWGTAYDGSPVPDAEHRSPRIPDGDRVWVTCGTDLQMTPQLRLGCSYMHTFVTEGEIARTGSMGDQLTGEYDGRADLINLSLRWDL